MIERIRQAASEAFPGIELTLSVDGRNIVTVQGECESWNQLVDVGHFLAKQEGVKNVGNEMTVKGLQVDPLDYFSKEVLSALTEDSIYEGEADK